MTKIAFKNTESGVYYAFNSDLTALKIVSSLDSTNWNDSTILDTLPTASYRDIYGLELITQTEYDDDTFTASFTTYDIVTSTDTTAYSLAGYSAINSFKALASDDCMFLISFDGRNTWYSYGVDPTDTTKNTWITVANPEQYIYSKGMATSKVNALTALQIKEVYKRTQLDFMVAIPTNGYFESLTLNLPGNTKPTASNIVLSSIDTHKEDVTVFADVTDLDGDDIHWKVTINSSTDPIAEGNVLGEAHIDTHTIKFTVSLTDLIVGVNKITLHMDDSKATNTETVYITRNNTTPIASGILNNNTYSISIADTDDDKIRYRIYLNDELLEDWSRWQKSPFSYLYIIPKEKIVYGTVNHLVVEYMDDGDLSLTHKLTEDFVGSYYGLLFTDLNNEFYCDSLGGIVKMLTPPNIVASNASQSYEVYVYNKSNNVLETVNITAPTISDNINLELSYSDAPFMKETSLTFSNMNVLDKQKFYVKVVTNNDQFVGDFKLPIDGIGTIK